MEGTGETEDIDRDGVMGEMMVEGPQCPRRARAYGTFGIG
jgi:hypothetical protein